MDYCSETVVDEKMWMSSPDFSEDQGSNPDDMQKQILIQMSKFELNRLLIEHQMKFNAEKRKNQDVTKEMEELNKHLTSLSEEKDVKIAKLKQHIQELEDTIRAEKDRKKQPENDDENSRLSAALAEAQRTRQEVMERMTNLENIINELQNNPLKKKKTAWKRFIQVLQDNWRKGYSKWRLKIKKFSIFSQTLMQRYMFTAIKDHYKEEIHQPMKRLH